MWKRAVLAALVLALGVPAPAIAAPDHTGYAVRTKLTAYAVTIDNKLLRFDVPETPTPTIAPTLVGPVVGLLPGQQIAGIDFRAANGKLYALAGVPLGGNTGPGTVYSIDTNTAVATLISPAPITLSGVAFGFDINPLVDRIRVVSDTDQNIRINPDTGTLAATDTPLNPPGQQIVGIAYTPGATTSLHALGAFADAVYNVPSPNNGQVVLSGSLTGITLGTYVGFDIAPDGRALMANQTAGPGTDLFDLHLQTGQTTKLASIPGLTIAAMSVTATQELISFSTATPSTVTAVGTITGMGALELIVAMDFRPSNGKLYGLGSFSRLYTVDKATAVATSVGTAGSFTLSGTAWGFDVNPIVDRIRVISDSGQNIRLNPDAGTLAATDTPMGPGFPRIAGAAYTPGDATTLYDIDYQTDSLLRQGGVNGSPSPNLGLLTLIGPLGVNTMKAVGFDIAADGIAYAVLDVPGNSSGFYTVNLSTGAATLVGAVGDGTVVDALAIAPTTPASEPPPELPNTGLPLGPLVAAALLLLVTGMLLRRARTAP